MTGGWRLEEREGTAGGLHASWPAVERDPQVRAVAVCRVTAPAVVLGSTQPDSVVDRRRVVAAGMSVARRRSGGGAVLVTEEGPLWVDVWVPAGDPLWHPDVGRAFDWLGAAWVSALRRCGTAGLSVRGRSGVVGTRWSTLVCFGGVGRGEVTADDGCKVVGLAQRRNRDGSWFHGACVLRWDPVPLVRVLALPGPEREEASSELASAAVGVADLADRSGRRAPEQVQLTAALVDSLPG